MKIKYYQTVGGETIKFPMGGDYQGSGDAANIQLQKDILNAMVMNTAVDRTIDPSNGRKYSQAYLNACEVKMSEPDPSCGSDPFGCAIQGYKSSLGSFAYVANPSECERIKADPRLMYEDGAGGQQWPPPPVQQRQQYAPGPAMQTRRFQPDGPVAPPQTGIVFPSHPTPIWLYIVLSVLGTAALMVLAWWLFGGKKA